MKSNIKIGIRESFILLLIITILPLSILIIYHIIIDMNHQIESLEKELKTGGDLISNRTGDSIHAINQLLFAIANIGVIRNLDAQGSSDYLAKLAPNYIEYTNIAVVNAEGVFIASTIPFKKGFSSYGNPWFKRLQNERRFVVGDFRIGRITKKPGIVFAYPLPGQATNNPLASVFISLNLDFFHKITSQIKLPKGSTIAIVDTNWSILSRNPDPENWVGKKQSFLKNINSENGELQQFVEAPGADGVDRLYYITKVPYSNDQLSVLVGLPKKQIMAETYRKILLSLLLWFSVIAFDLFFLWIIGRRLVINPIREFSESAIKLGEGDLLIRTNESYALKELAQLSQAFNAMAQSLSHNISLMQVLVDTIPNPIYIKDVQGNYISCNKAMATFLGKTKPEIIGKNVFDVLPMEKASVINKKDTELMSNPGVQIFELDFTTGDGVERSILSTMAVFNNKNEEIGGIVGILTDITERKRTEQEIVRLNIGLEKTVQERTARLELLNQELLAGHERYRIVADFTHDWEYWLGPDSKFLYVSPSCEKITGYTPDEFIHNPDLFSEIIYAEDTEKVNSHLLHSSEVYHSSEFEFRINRRDGEVRWIGHVCNAVYGDKGEFMGKRASNRDITEHKRLSADREFFFDEALDMVCIASLDGYFKQLSPAWTETLGWSTDELLSRPYIEFTHPDDIAPTIEATKVLADGVNVVNFDNRYLCRDGSYRWLSWRTSVSMEQQLAYAVARDITEVKATQTLLENLNEQLKARTEEAESANKSKSEFLANMSHEIRTPMNSILGFSEVLVNLINDKKQREYLHAILASGKTLLTLINDILDLSKIEAGKIEIKLAPVDFRMVAKEIEMIFKPKCVEKDVSLELMISPDLPALLFLDEMRLRQVIFNLVGNAVKFTSQGKIVFGVDVHRIPAPKEQSVLEFIFYVKDTGIGIRKDQQDLVFLPFQQQKNQVSTYGGTGLGLAISRRLVELMGGRIELSSEPGIGSEFRVILSGVELSAGVLSSEQPFEPANYKFENVHILIADDIEYNRKVLSSMLSVDGITVTTAIHGSDVLEQLTVRKPDIILLDIRMPVMDGYRTLTYLKSHSDYKDIPVVAVTASVLGDAEKNAIDAGFDGYIRKPVTRSEVFRIIVNLLAGNKVISVALPEKAADIIQQNIGVSSPQLIAILRREILPACDQLKHKLFIERIREIATRAEGLAIQYQDQVLQNWAEQLTEYINNYDTAGMKKMMSSLHNLIPEP